MMSTESIHIAGRYNKYERNLSQSPWIDKDDVRIKHSVQELIEDGLKQYLQFDKSIFSSSGREDVDVRMLGTGRPFVFRMVNPFNPDNYNNKVMRQIQKYINDTHGSKIRVRDLQVVSKRDVSENLKEGQESKTKEYRALCCCERTLTAEEKCKISNMIDLTIDQKTPIRVLHRRSLTVRQRSIHKMSVESVDPDEFTSLKAEHLDKVFVLNLLTEAGTYIKEFVHGDFGRTEPSLSTILDDCETDLMELDVMGVNLDWPPHLTDDGEEESEELRPESSVPISTLEDKMDKSDLNLVEVYTAALKTLREAESLPRGDKRQELYVKSRHLFENVLSIIDKIDLFSDNETIDDIATGNLKYLLVPAYLAKIALSAECGSKRLETFTRAETMIKAFFQRVLDYGLGDQHLERILKSNDNLQGSGPPVDTMELAMRDRSEKIEKYKKRKLLESRLEELDRRVNSGAKDIDDEIMREHQLGLLNKWIEDMVESLEREVKPALFFERNQSEMQNSPAVSERSLPSRDSKPLKTITIVKDDLQKSVFGLGYPSRPTVTVDEFISQKMSEGGLAFQKHQQQNSLQRYAEQPDLLRQQEEMSDEEKEKKEEREDAEDLQRRRNWDEFKDDNPRGSVIDNRMDENESETLAKTRTRRSNAGARMHEMMFNAESNELFAQAYGDLLKPEDDSSDDEEYVPKDLINGGEEGGVDGDDGDECSNSGDGSSSGSDDEDDEDEEESDEDEEQDDEDDKSRLDRYKIVDEVKINQKHLANIKQEKDSSNDNVANIPHLEPGSPPKAAYASCYKICSVCLGDQSDEDDEIIECDSCGVSVHEGCYGVQSEDENKNETTSVHSNISSESTEPWFCEPCKRSAFDVNCELCPNKDGIFKQTDTGRWVHMVCALYIRGVTFENIDTLSEVSLFELNYALYGSKACTICEDRRLARSGVCIGCDAGLCKTFFHATCAQKEGLLFESHSDEVDPYFAQCRQHADKSIIRKKKRLCTALHARLRRIQPLQNCSDRIKKKLSEITKQPDLHLAKWTPENRPPIPIRVSRMLMTSPSLIIRLTKKSELMGLDPNSAFMSVQDEMEMARQKWHIPPAFNLEFIAYCKDRTTRMVQMKKQNVELVDQNLTLKNEESRLRENYNSIIELVNRVKIENEVLVKKARALQKLVTTTTGKQFTLPLQIEQLIAQCSNTKSKNHVKASKNTSKTSSTYGCGKCGTVKDQHLLTLCDTCHSYFHIYCLDPPLARVPKKTKFGGWQCSDCSEKDEEEQEEAEEEKNILAVKEADGPRKLRERIKYPEKYCHESMMMADFWSLQKKRPKKPNKGISKGKKPKVES